jgi:myo-inositol 2-dehydrogenase/D-chiro-inositol 1-dehydrogenase
MSEIQAPVTGRDRWPLRVALIGAGRIGTSHAELLANRVPGVELAMVFDPAPGAAAKLAAELRVPAATQNLDEVWASPDIDAVVIAAPARSHSDLVVAAASAGKHVFVEKPMAVTLADADRAIEAAESAGVVLQVGFNRRFAPGFAAARAEVDAGTVGTPQLLRSLTRDPGPYRGDPARTPLWTIFFETLIHDFDTLCWLNPAAKPVRVTALADALVRPDAREAGHLDTAVVTIQFDNGAIAVAEANFCAMYGYDVRGEVFGSLGMAVAGDVRSSDLAVYTAAGVAMPTSRLDSDLLRSAYLGEFEAFATAVRTGADSPVPGSAARLALSIALAAIRSVQEGRGVALEEVER